MISKALNKIHSEIGGNVTLVAVSKQQPIERVRVALDSGQRVFGENRVQEASEKWPELKSEYPDIELHMIGPLQSNKAGDAVLIFDVIQTLDRKKIADACAEEEQKQNKKLSYYIQVNTGEEPQKSGILPQDLNDFYTYIKDNTDLNVIGLMCIPPIDESPGLHFALLKKLAGQLELPELSMGMSNDYKTACQFGATTVRIGSALFGNRK